MTFEDAKAHLRGLEYGAREAGRPLSSYPKGPMGLTPDHIKATPQWHKERAEYEAARKRLVTFTAWFVKTFAKEYKAERVAKYQSKTP